MHAVHYAFLLYTVICLDQANSSDEEVHEVSQVQRCLPTATHFSATSPFTTFTGKFRGQPYLTSHT
jgi:hypothetical protein